MRIFLWILLILFLLIGLLMALTAVLRVRYRDGVFTWQVRVCGIPLLPALLRIRKKPRADAAAANKEGASGDAHRGGKRKAKEKGSRKGRGHHSPKLTEEQKKKLLMDRIWNTMQDSAEKMDTAGSILSALPLPLRTLCKGISLCRVQTDFLIADADAARCAELYGEVQAGMHLLLSSLGRVIRVRRKRIRIKWDYTADACRWDCGVDLRVRVGPLLTAALYFWIGYQRDIRRAKKALSGWRL